MDTENELIKNRVAQSPLVLIDLTEYYHKEIERIGFDINPLLFQGLILKEAEFRDSLKKMDLTGFKGKIVHIYCSSDAIIPLWAYFLITVHLQPLCHFSGFGTRANVDTLYLLNQIEKIDLKQFEGKKLVIKGCSDLLIDENVYLSLVNRLVPVANSLMFGEPCSTVPVFKRKA